MPSEKEAKICAPGIALLHIAVPSYDCSTGPCLFWIILLVISLYIVIGDLHENV